jgi:hypothetical protein
VIRHFKYESDGMESVLTELREGIDSVLDALASIGPEKRGSLDLTYALANLRKGYAWLECETIAQRKGGAS